MKRYVTAQEVPRYRPRARPAELSAAQLAHVERRRAACPDLRATVLLRELADEYGYTGSYASLRRRVVILRPATAEEPVLRFETDPGEQTQGDWADVGTWPLGAGTAPLFAFVAILGCSWMIGIRFALDKTRPTTLRNIVRCVDDLGGATADFLTDRDTALMAGSRSGGVPIYAPEWLDVAALLGTRPRACRPYRARTKSRSRMAVATTPSANTAPQSKPRLDCKHDRAPLVPSRSSSAPRGRGRGHGRPPALGTAALRPHRQAYPRDGATTAERLRGRRVLTVSQLSRSGASW